MADRVAGLVEGGGGGLVWRVRQKRGGLRCNLPPLVLVVPDCDFKETAQQSLIKCEVVVVPIHGFKPRLLSIESSLWLQVGAKIL